MYRCSFIRDYIIDGYVDARRKHCLDYISFVSVTFQGMLDYNSPRFIRPFVTDYYPNYYYQTITVAVDTSGQYMLTSSFSSVSLFGCLYDTFFDPSNPSINLIVYSDGSTTRGQFSITYSLLSTKTYVLVVTTSSDDSFSSFTITASGSGVPSLQAMTISQLMNRREIHIHDI